MPLYYNKIVIGISGASGAIYGVRLLEKLKHLGIETHLVVTKYAKLTLSYELDITFEELTKLASHYHHNSDMAASIASGSFLCDGMIVAPCSIKTLSEIVHGVTSALVSRAADVALKERRKLILLVRESPLHLGHLDSMKQATQMGAIIMPPVNAFYIRPQNIDDLINHTVNRVLDQFHIEGLESKRWPDINDA